MSVRLLLIALLLLTLPSALYARWIKDKVIYDVAATGQVEFSHYNQQGLSDLPQRGLQYRAQ